MEKSPKNFLEKVSQCRKWVNQPIPYLYTLPNSVSSCPKPKKCRQPIRIEHEEPSHFVSQPQSNTEKTFNFVSQSISSITSPESSANQNRALRHPRALGSGGGPFSALGSRRLAIALLNTCGPPPPPPRQLCSLFYYLRPYWQHRLLVGSHVAVGGIEVPPQYFKLVSHTDSLLQYVFHCLPSVLPCWIVYCSTLILMYM